MAFKDYWPLLIYFNIYLVTSTSKLDNSYRTPTTVHFGKTSSFSYTEKTPRILASLSFFSEEFEENDRRDEIWKHRARNIPRWDAKDPEFDPKTFRLDLMNVLSKAKANQTNAGVKFKVNSKFQRIKRSVLKQVPESKNGTNANITLTDTLNQTDTVTPKNLSKRNVLNVPVKIQRKTSRFRPKASTKQRKPTQSPVNSSCGIVNGSLENTTNSIVPFNCSGFYNTTKTNSTASQTGVTNSSKKFDVTTNKPILDFHDLVTIENDLPDTSIGTRTPLRKFKIPVMGNEKKDKIEILKKVLKTPSAVALHGFVYNNHQVFNESITTETVSTVDPNWFEKHLVSHKYPKTPLRTRKPSFITAGTRFNMAKYYTTFPSAIKSNPKFTFKPKVLATTTSSPETRLPENQTTTTKVPEVNTTREYFTFSVPELMPYEQHVEEEPHWAVNLTAVKFNEYIPYTTTVFYLPDDIYMLDEEEDKVINRRNGEHLRNPFIKRKGKRRVKPKRVRRTFKSDVLNPFEPFEGMKKNTFSPVRVRRTISDLNAFAPFDGIKKNALYPSRNRRARTNDLNGRQDVLWIRGSHFDFLKFTSTVPTKTDRLWEGNRAFKGWTGIPGKNITQRPILSKKNWKLQSNKTILNGTTTQKTTTTLNVKKGPIITNFKDLMKKPPKIPNFINDNDKLLQIAGLERTTQLTTTSSTTPEPTSSTTSKIILLSEIMRENICKFYQPAHAYVFSISKDIFRPFLMNYIYEFQHTTPVRFLKQLYLKEDLSHLTSSSIQNYQPGSRKISLRDLFSSIKIGMANLRRKSRFEINKLYCRAISSFPNFRPINSWEKIKNSVFRKSMVNNLKFLSAMEFVETQSLRILDSPQSFNELASEPLVKNLISINPYDIPPLLSKLESMSSKILPNSETSISKPKLKNNLTQGKRILEDELTTPERKRRNIFTKKISTASTLKQSDTTFRINKQTLTQKVTKYESTDPTIRSLHHKHPPLKQSTISPLKSTNKITKARNTIVRIQRSFKTSTRRHNKKPKLFTKYGTMTSKHHHFHNTATQLFETTITTVNPNGNLTRNNTRMDKREISKNSDNRNQINQSGPKISKYLMIRNLSANIFRNSETSTLKNVEPQTLNSTTSTKSTQYEQAVFKRVTEKMLLVKSSQRSRRTEPNTFNNTLVTSTTDLKSDLIQKHNLGNISKRLIENELSKKSEISIVQISTESWNPNKTSNSSGVRIMSPGYAPNSTQSFVLVTTELVDPSTLKRKSINKRDKNFDRHVTTKSKSPIKFQNTNQNRRAIGLIPAKFTTTSSLSTQRRNISQNQALTSTFPNSTISYKSTPLSLTANVTKSILTKQTSGWASKITTKGTRRPRKRMSVPTQIFLSTQQYFQMKNAEANTKPTFTTGRTRSNLYKKWQKPVTSSRSTLSTSGELKSTKSTRRIKMFTPRTKIQLSYKIRRDINASTELAPLNVTNYLIGNLTSSIVTATNGPEIQSIQNLRKQVSQFNFVNKTSLNVPEVKHLRKSTPYNTSEGRNFTIFAFGIKSFETSITLGKSRGIAPRPLTQISGIDVSQQNRQIGNMGEIIHGNVVQSTIKTKSKNSTLYPTKTNATRIRKNTHTLRPEIHRLVVGDQTDVTVMNISVNVSSSFLTTKPSFPSSPAFETNPNSFNVTSSFHMAKRLKPFTKRNLKDTTTDKPLQQTRSKLDSLETTTNLNYVQLFSNFSQRNTKSYQKREMKVGTTIQTTINWQSKEYLNDFNGNATTKTTSSIQASKLKKHSLGIDNQNNVTILKTSTNFVTPTITMSSFFSSLEPNSKIKVSTKPEFSDKTTDKRITNFTTEKLMTTIEMKTFLSNQKSFLDSMALKIRKQKISSENTTINSKMAVTITSTANKSSFTKLLNKSDILWPYPNMSNVNRNSTQATEQGPISNDTARFDYLTSSGDNNIKMNLINSASEITNRLTEFTTRFLSTNKSNHFNASINNLSRLSSLESFKSIQALKLQNQPKLVDVKPLGFSTTEPFSYLLINRPYSGPNINDIHDAKPVIDSKTNASTQRPTNALTPKLDILENQKDSTNKITPTELNYQRSRSPIEEKRTAPINPRLKFYQNLVPRIHNIDEDFRFSGFQKNLRRRIKRSLTPKQGNPYCIKKFHKKLSVPRESPWLNLSPHNYVQLTSLMNYFVTYFFDSKDYQTDPPLPNGLSNYNKMIDNILKLLHNEERVPEKPCKVKSFEFKHPWLNISNRRILTSAMKYLQELKPSYSIAPNPTENEKTAITNPFHNTRDIAEIAKAVYLNFGKYAPKIADKIDIVKEEVELLEKFVKENNICEASRKFPVEVTNNFGWKFQVKPDHSVHLPNNNFFQTLLESISRKMWLFELNSFYKLHMQSMQSQESRVHYTYVLPENIVVVQVYNQSTPESQIKEVRYQLESTTFKAEPINSFWKTLPILRNSDSKILPNIDYDEAEGNYTILGTRKNRTRRDLNLIIINSKFQNSKKKNQFKKYKHHPIDVKTKRTKRIVPDLFAIQKRPSKNESFPGNLIKRTKRNSMINKYTELQSYFNEWRLNRFPKVDVPTEDYFDLDDLNRIKRDIPEISKTNQNFDPVKWVRRYKSPPKTKRYQLQNQTKITSLPSLIPITTTERVIHTPTINRFRTKVFELKHRFRVVRPRLRRSVQNETEISQVLKKFRNLLKLLVESQKLNGTSKPNSYETPKWQIPIETTTYVTPSTVNVNARFKEYSMTVETNTREDFDTGPLPYSSEKVYYWSSRMVPVAQRRKAKSKQDGSRKPVLILSEEKTLNK